MKDVEKKVYLGILVCLLVSIVGTSFAYFLGGVTVTGSGTKASGDTGNLISVAYDGGTSDLTLSGAIPGNSQTSKTFDISISPTATSTTAEYSILINISSNTFQKTSTTINELEYTLTKGGTTVATGDLAGSTSSITLYTDTFSGSTATTYEYVLTVKYNDTNVSQDVNKSAVFSGNIDVQLVAS